VEPPALQDENALDEQPEQEQKLSRMVIAEEHSDSDSQIIFIEIETESPKAQEKQDEESPEPRALVDIDIEVAKEGPTPDPEQDLDEIMVEVISGSPSLWSADDEAEEEEDRAAERTTPPQGEAESTSPAPRRSRRSAQARGNSRQGKTLEETFTQHPYFWLYMYIYALFGSINIFVGDSLWERCSRVRDSRGLHNVYI